MRTQKALGIFSLVLISACGGKPTTDAALNGSWIINDCLKADDGSYGEEFLEFTGNKMIMHDASYSDSSCQTMTSETQLQFTYRVSAAADKNANFKNIDATYTGTFLTYGNQTVDVTGAKIGDTNSPKANSVTAYEIYRISDNKLYLSDSESQSADKRPTEISGDIQGYPKK